MPNIPYRQWARLTKRQRRKLAQKIDALYRSQFHFIEAAPRRVHIAIRATFWGGALLPVLALIGSR